MSLMDQAPPPHSLGGSAPLPRDREIAIRRKLRIDPAAGQAGSIDRPPHPPGISLQATQPALCGVGCSGSRADGVAPPSHRQVFSALSEIHVLKSKKKEKLLDAFRVTFLSSFFLSAGSKQDRRHARLPEAPVRVMSSPPSWARKRSPRAPFMRAPPGRELL